MQSTRVSTRQDQRKGGVRLAFIALAMVLFGSACGSSGDTSAPVGDGATQAGAAVQDDASSAPVADAGQTTEESTEEADTGRSRGSFAVGDIYDDGEYRATYLGLARIPVGPDIFDGGACFAPLFEVTYLDPFGDGSDEFRPSLDAHLLDGTLASKDQTGVGCDTKVLAPAGYAWLNDTPLEGGQPTIGHLSAFHVATGSVDDVDVFTIYGNEPVEQGFEAVVSEDLSS